jgi:FkbM family methyltransferase
MTNLDLAIGEAYRWYITKAQHPFKSKVLGHWWGWFCKPSVWIKYDGDLVIKVRLRDYIQRSIFMQGYYEPDLVQLLKSELHPSDVFWDVGANVGAMTLIAARRCKQVFSFEPEPRVLARLREHLEVNGLAHVRVMPLALSDAGGRVMMSQAPEENSGMNSLCRTDLGWSRQEVEAIRADDLVARGDVACPNVMKVDVEGAEAMVFSGATSLLRNPALRLVVFEAALSKDALPVNAKLTRMLEAAGFTVSPFTRSDITTNDGMGNFLARRAH